jgi:CHAT domain-containing protein/tetratricopeptide (TPR) repeat protein
MMSKSILVMVVLSGLLFASASSPGSPDPTPPSPTPPAPLAPLSLGAPLVRDLQAAETQSYRVELPAGRTFRVAVEQRGIDVTVSVTAPDVHGTAVDSPLDRQGTESLLVSPSAAGTYRIEVHAREPGAPPAGRYEIRIDELLTETPANADDPAIAAEAALTKAGELYLRGTAESRRRALPFYRQGREDFRAAGDRRGEARALHELAVVSRLVDETRPALEAAQEVLGLWQGLSDGRFAAAAANEVGLDTWLSGQATDARTAFGQALELSRGAGDVYGEAVAQSNLCLMDLVRGELHQGVACYGRALPLLEEVRAEELLGGALTSVGRAYDALGEPQEARARYEQALARLRSTGNRAGEARALNNLGVLAADLGEVQEALHWDGQALAIFRQLEDRRWQARVLNNLGLVYQGVEDPRQALASYEQALALWRAVGDPQGEGSTLINLGMVQRDLGTHQGDLGTVREALAAIRQALKLKRAAGDHRGEGIALVQLGRTEKALGEEEEALSSFIQAAALLAAAGDLPNGAEALRGEGEIEAGRGAEAEAKASLTRALEASRAASYQPGEAQILYALARAERRFGRDEAAREHAEAALGVMESLGARIGSTDLRASYSAVSHDAYELAIDLAMDAHAKDSGAGHDREALALGERARARTLLALLSTAGVHIEEGVAGPLLARREALSERLAAKALRAAGERATGGSRQAADAEQQEIVRELDVVDAEIRTASPSSAALTRPQPLGAGEIQQLLDADTALLVYSLGEERSFLWWVTPREVASFVLPPRATVEAAARRLHDRFSQPDPAGRGETAGAAAALSRILLGPLAGRLGESGVRRLAVVPDGALAYVPFAALPLPSATPVTATETVLARYEVVSLPSASALAVTRQALARRPAAARWLAAFADPVFDPADPRLPAALRSVRSPRSLRAKPGSPVPPTAATAQPAVFERLPASRQEAEAIAALAPPGQATIALDFDASRSAVLGDRLAGFRTIHFATHGVIDTERPALSGLALSNVDREGKPQEGFLSLRDLYNLHLDADLVVLSGCRTALGREVRGEGLMGITRGFQYAGATRVLASLWRVEDRATAELMTRFYHALWKDGLPAAAALRQAQLALQKERHFRDPSSWAAFVLEGDWR